MDKREKRKRGTVRRLLFLVAVAAVFCLGQRMAVKAEKDSAAEHQTEEAVEDGAEESAEEEAEKNRYVDEQGIQYTLSRNRTCYVTGYTDQIKASVTIPEELFVQEGQETQEEKGIRYQVAGFRPSALANCTALKELTIPNSVTKLEEKVFQGCKNLKKLTILPVKTSFQTKGTEAILTVKINSGLLCSQATSVLEVEKNTVKEALAASGTDLVTVRVLVQENPHYQTGQAQLQRAVWQEAAVKAAAKSGKNIRVKIKNPATGFSCMMVPSADLRQRSEALTLSFVELSVNDLADTYKTDMKKVLKKNKLKEKQVKIVRISSLDDSVTAEVSFSTEGMDGVTAGSELYVYRYQKSKRRFLHTTYQAYHVSQKGNITFSAEQGGTYLLSSKKLSSMADPLRSRFFRQSGETYYVGKDGSLAYGWRKIGDGYYYFNRQNGKMASDCTVDGIQLQEEGMAKQTDGAVEKIQTMIKARRIVEKVTSPNDSTSVKMQKCFRWIFQFPYYRYRRLKPIYQEKGWEVTFANDIFDHKRGCCVSEASALAFLFHECGVKTVYVCHDTGHAWTEVDGRVYDPLFAEARGIDGYYNVSYQQAKLHVVGKRKI